jgi:hypothetical protein
MLPSRFALPTLALLTAPLAAQTPSTTPYAPDSVAAADYARAESFLGQSTGPLVYGAVGTPEWLSDGRFWYRTSTREGVAFVLVDPARRTRERLFDPDRSRRRFLGERLAVHRGDAADGDAGGGPRGPRGLVVRRA